MESKSVFISILAAVCIAALFVPLLGAADADNAVPFMRRVEPVVVKVEDAVTAFGQALDRSRVADVMLTTDSKQVPVEVLEQTESFIRFRVPANLEPGKYYPAVLMVKEPMVLVQPVILTVEATKRAPLPEPTK